MNESQPRPYVYGDGNEAQYIIIDFDNPSIKIYRKSVAIFYPFCNDMPCFVDAS